MTQKKTRHQLIDQYLLTPLLNRCRLSAYPRESVQVDFLLMCLEVMDNGDVVLNCDKLAHMLHRDRMEIVDGKMDLQCRFQGFAHLFNEDGTFKNNVE